LPTSPPWSPSWRILKRGTASRRSIQESPHEVHRDHPDGARRRKLTADILQAPMPVMEMLKEKGVLAAYTSPAAAGYPKWTNKDGKIQSFGIEYAPDLQQGTRQTGGCPKKYEDLADPKWKGKIVMADPSSHPTTISWLIGLRKMSSSRKRNG